MRRRSCDLAQRILDAIEWLRVKAPAEGEAVH